MSRLQNRVQDFLFPQEHVNHHRIERSLENQMLDGYRIQGANPMEAVLALAHFGGNPGEFGEKTN